MLVDSASLTGEAMLSFCIFCSENFGKLSLAMTRFLRRGYSDDNCIAELWGARTIESDSNVTKQSLLDDMLAHVKYSPDRAVLLQQILVQPSIMINTSKKKKKGEKLTACFLTLFLMKCENNSLFVEISSSLNGVWIGNLLIIRRIWHLDWLMVLILDNHVQFLFREFQMNPFFCWAKT